MQYDNLISTCYPQFRMLGRALKYIPLTGRSLLIKSCQAQTLYRSSETPSSPLHHMLLSHPPCTVPHPHSGSLVEVNLIEFLELFEIDMNPLSSAILLDIIRGYPPSYDDRISFIDKGWHTELRLVDILGSPEVNFFPFFFPDLGDTIHPALPTNLPSLHYIRSTFQRWKTSLLALLRSCILYPFLKIFPMFSSMRSNIRLCHQPNDLVEPTQST
jgi:hypothetical protein